MSIILKVWMNLIPIPGAIDLQPAEIGFEYTLDKCLN